MDRHRSRTKLLDAATQVLRARGYTATRVEDVCEAAQLTKGSFFHHFKTKEELAVAATDHWTEVTGAFFANAPYRKLADPRDRVFGYLEFRRAIAQGAPADFSCLAGTMVQEVYDASPAIRAACDRSMSAHVAVVAADLAEAKRRYAPAAAWDPEAVALYTHAVLQGAFVLAKTKDEQGAAVVGACLDQLRAHLEALLPRPERRKRR